LGKRQAEDAWIESLSRTIYRGRREEAADAVAAGLAEGMTPEVVGEAISLAANQLVLHDPGRRQEHASAVKPAGSVHGDSVGVHASDAANAWRNVARVSNQRNTVASLIVGAYHTAGQSRGLNQEPFPLPALGRACARYSMRISLRGSGLCGGMSVAQGVAPSSYNAVSRSQVSREGEPGCVSAGVTPALT